ncbi:MAG: phosphate ABC transporter permease PstA [Haloarculaceae archaeon]
MSDAYADRVDAATDGRWWQSLAYSAMGIGVLVAFFGVVNFLNWVGLSSSVGSVGLVTLYGIGLAWAGAVTVGVGLGSARGLFDTNPAPQTGSIAGAFTGLTTFVIVGLVVSQTLGLGGVAWFLPALVLGVLAFAATSVAPEDLGSTLPWGGLALLTAVVFLSGTISTGWDWGPTGFGFAFTGRVVIPSLAIIVGLLVAWAATKTALGFGARGRESAANLLIGANAFFMLGLLLLLVLFIVEKGAPAALEGAHLGPGLSVHLPFLTNGGGLGVEVKGVFPALVGTFWLVFGAILFAVPLGVGAAIYLSEYATRGRFTAIVDTTTDGLWSTPSIVYGLFGYAFLVPRLGNHQSILAGMLVLGFMLIPLVLITSREAIQSVPDPYRDASAALGVTKWQTIRSVVIPAALPGIITGIILGVGRIAGETAPLLFVAAGGLNGKAVDIIGSFHFTGSAPFVANDALLSPTNALPYQIYAVIEAGVGGSEQFGWGTAFVLLVLVLCFYLVGIATRLYFRDKLQQ